MKKLCLFLWAVLLLHACETTPIKKNTINFNDTLNYERQIKQSNQWTINTNRKNIMITLKVMKAYEHGDTAQLHRCVANNLTVYYNGGIFKGSSREFMYAVKARVNTLKNLHFELKDWQSVISRDKKTEKVITWCKQRWLDENGRPDSVDVINEARFKNGKITTWYEYTRNYRAE